MEQPALIETMRLVAYLAGCVVRGEAPDAARLEAADPDALLDAARRHSLEAIAAAGLESAGLATPATSQATARGLWRSAQLEADWQPVRAAMEAAGIWYCPLKGAAIKGLYPAFGLRQMADYDILFDASRADDLRDIMLAQGFTSEHFGQGAHDVYYKLPVSNFEMHRSLFAESAEHPYTEYFAAIEERLLKDADNACGWHMTLEDAYLYLLAHEEKHFSVCGTGLRSSLDIYVYLRAHAADMDWDEIRGTARELGLFDFEEQQRSFAQRLFDECALTPEDEALFAYMATSSTYGSISHRVDNRLASMGATRFAKLRYLGERLFPSLDGPVAESYPFFAEHRILAPVFYVYRLGRGLFTSRRNIAAAELKTLATADAGESAANKVAKLATADVDD